MTRVKHLDLLSCTAWRPAAQAAEAASATAEEEEAEDIIINVLRNGRECFPNPLDFISHFSAGLCSSFSPAKSPSSSALNCRSCSIRANLISRESSSASASFFFVLFFFCVLSGRLSSLFLPLACCVTVVFGGSCLTPLKAMFLHPPRPPTPPNRKRRTKWMSRSPLISQHALHGPDSSRLQPQNTALKQMRQSKMAPNSFHWGGCCCCCCCCCGGGGRVGCAIKTSNKHTGGVTSPGAGGGEGQGSHPPTPLH